MADALHCARWVRLEPDENAWRVERAMVKYVESAWQEPDEGIWEVRGPRKLFTHSRVMAWVAVDRAVKAVERFGLESSGMVGRIVVGRPGGPGTQPFDYFVGRPGTGDWGHVPQAAQAVFPSVETIVALGVVNRR